MRMTRREMCSLLPAAALPLAAVSPAEAGETDAPLLSASYAFEKLSVETAKSGAQIRKILAGKLATGEIIETHATTLPAGAMPHPAHHHVHSEMFFVREGNLELTVNGTVFPLAVGSVGFVHSNDEHSIKNVGKVAANYFVLEIGPDLASA